MTIRVAQDPLVLVETEDNEQIVLARPGLELLLFSEQDLATCMSAAADALREFVSFLPPGSLRAVLQDDDDDAEDSPMRWLDFDRARQDALMRTLSADDAEGPFDVMLISDPDRGARNASEVKVWFQIEDADCDSVTCLRFELSRELVAARSIDDVMAVIDRIAARFPFSSGNAGLCFLHSNAYVTSAKSWIDRQIFRFLGFDAAHFDTIRANMRQKAPPAHWLNFLDVSLVDALGGKDALRKALPSCEIASYPGGRVRIRSAKLPPVGDVEAGSLDLGAMPDVARVLKPIRLEPDGVEYGFDADGAERWVRRLDTLKAEAWNNDE